MRPPRVPMEPSCALPIRVRMDAISNLAGWLNRRWWGKPFAWLIYGVFAVFTAVCAVVALAGELFLLAIPVAAVYGLVHGGGGSTGSRCDPSYKGACLDPDAADYDCAGGTGDGSKYTGAVRIVGDDHYGLDRDGNGYGCE
jgi:hypothetical protein